MSTSTIKSYYVSFSAWISYQATICCVDRGSDGVRIPALMESDSICSAVENALELNVMHIGVDSQSGKEAKT